MPLYFLNTHTILIIHYILFNVNDVDNISTAWGMGRVQVDECNVNTIDYVLKYMVKTPEDKYYDDKQSEKAFMSKGLGLNALDKEQIKYIKTPEGNILVNTRGNKVGLPRYYRKKYLTEDEILKKNQYIADNIAKQGNEEEKAAKLYNVDIGTLKHNAKIARYNTLTKRLKRNN